MGARREREIRAEAAIWLARLRADDRSAEDIQAFHAWLAEDPDHVAAFETVNAVWESAGAVRAPVSAHQRFGALRRRDVLAGLGALTIAGLTVVRWRPAAARVYETRIGEQRRVSLQDGSTVFLDTDTAVRVEFTRSARLLRMQHGQVFVRAREDSARPLIASLAGQTVDTPGASLDLCCEPGTASVTVIEGSATLTSDNADGPATLLRAGDRVRARAGRPLLFDRPNLTYLEAWRSGQAVFDDSTLAQAVAAMNRYSTVRLVIADPKLAALRISGVYRIGNNYAFARSLGELMPVDFRIAGREILLVPRR